MDEAADLRRTVRERLATRDPASVAERRLARFRGCLSGGAIGDALGAPIEFLSRAQIAAAFGPAGPTDFAPAYGKLGAITDDTQMTLFTAEGLLRSYVRAAMRGIGPVPVAVTDRAYARWMATQGERSGLGGGAGPDGWLIGHRDLHARRGPGMTCLSALRIRTETGAAALNDSKGCGGVMRAAPVGLFGASLRRTDVQTFVLGCDIAGLTHGHPTGQLTAGLLAVLVAALATARPWDEAVARGTAQLVTAEHHDETSGLLAKALDAAQREPFSHARLMTLGEGWVAEEALAIGVYCAASAVLASSLDESAVRDALLLAVNHGGDSDSTGSIAGNLLGALVGDDGLPAAWRAKVELTDVIDEVAEDLATVPAWAVSDYLETDECRYWWTRYPGA